MPEYMSFGEALAALKAGRWVARSGWNGKEMFLFLVPGSQDYHAHIDMKTQGYVVPWVASQADMLDDDWEVVGGYEGFQDLEN